MSIIHPGTSINFDGTDLQRSEEDEIQQEDIKQQQELRELLSAELPEDLLDDSCNGSMNSQPRPDNDQTSYSNSQPSSNTGSWQSGSTDGHPNITSSGDGSAFFTNQPSIMPHHNTNGYGKDYMMNAYNQPYTDAEKWQMQQRYRQSQAQHLQIPTHDNGADKHLYYPNDHFNHSAPNPEIYGFTERREAEGSEDFDVVNHDSSYGRDIKAVHGYPTFTSPPSRSINGSGKNVRFQATSAPTSPYSNHYPPQYQPQNRISYRRTDEISHSPKTNSSNKGDDSVGSDYVDASDRNLTEEVNESRELTQLRILYDARGKKIEKMTREVEAMRQEGEREKRILSHQLALAEDQRMGISGSLEECQRLLVEKDRKINEGEGKLNALLVEVESLKVSKTDMVKKIEVGERTIENLQQEVTLLQRSDALERTRQQHDNILANLNEKHERHLLEVTTMLDEVRRVADEKTEETENLRNRLKAALKESEDVLFEKSETINRLSRNLEDAQNHCQSLLAGSGESAFLQRQVNDLAKEKSSMEEKNKILETSVVELQRNLSMYENAFRLGVTPRPLTPDVMNDSYSELMGTKENLDSKYPKANGNNKSPDDIVNSLRQELERALTNNKEKRDKVTDLQKQVKDLNEESRHWRERLEDLKLENDFVKSSSNPRHSDLEREFEESLERVHSAEERAMRLEETCRDLKHQMSELVEQHDNNKQDAVDRCERACMLLHEDAKQAIRDELTAEYEQKVYEVTVEHEGALLDLRNKMEAINNELTEVKQSYVHICSEKDLLEEKLKHEKTEDQNSLVEEFENEKEKMKIEFEEKWNLKKEELEKELEEGFEERMTTKIALAKVSWMEEHANLREDALRDFAKKKEEDFNNRLEGLRNDLKIETEKEIARVVEHEKTQWTVEKEKEIQSRINELYEELNEDKQTAVTAATSIAQLNWITEQRSSTEAEVEKRINEAKRAWQEEHDRVLTSKIDESTKKLQNKIEVLNDERDTLVNQEVRRAEKEWRRKRDESLRRKDDEMQSQLKKIQEKHQKEYEDFTKHHKQSLETFLQSERAKSSNKQKQTNVTHDKQWCAERDDLLRNHHNELEKLEAMHDSRCQDYRSEIERLSSAYEILMQRLSMRSDQDETSKVVEIQQKNKEEMERLKSRMKDEYRRWKRERDDLRSKLDQCSKQSEQTKSSPTMDPAMFIELREIYISTLGTIKGEMLDFIREGRTRSVTALKREAGREKTRIATKLRSRSNQRERDSSVLPSFLASQHQSSHTSARDPQLMLGKETNKPRRRNLDLSPPTKQLQAVPRSKESYK